MIKSRLRVKMNLLGLATVDEQHEQECHDYAGGEDDQTPHAIPPFFVRVLDLDDGGLSGIGRWLGGGGLVGDGGGADGPAHDAEHEDHTEHQPEHGLPPPLHEEDMSPGTS